MTVTTTLVKYDIGEIYDAISDGATAVASFISRAQRDVKDITGTTTQDSMVRPLSDVYSINQFLGSLEAPEQKIGPISIGRRQAINMRNEFKDQFNDSAKRLGYNLDGQKNLFKMTFYN